MRAGDPAVEIGDAGDHRRPGLGRRVVVWPIVAARVEAQAAGFVQSRNAAIAQIRFYESPCDRLRHGEQPPRRFRRSGLRRHARRLRRWLRVGARQAQEAARLVGDVVEVEKAAALADDVEQVAVLARGGVGPFAGRSLRRLLQPDEHGAARCVAHVADQPVAALAPAIGEIVAAHRLGLARETVRQFGGVARHHAASRSPMRSIG